MIAPLGICRKTITTFINSVVVAIDIIFYNTIILLKYLFLMHLLCTYELYELYECCFLGCSSGVDNNIAVHGRSARSKVSHILVRHKSTKIFWTNNNINIFNNKYQQLIYNYYCYNSFSAIKRSIFIQTVSYIFAEHLI